jgi:hypothetical protein
VRLGQVDDQLYSGKLVVYNNWDKELSNQINKRDFKIFDQYNPRQDVLSVQMTAAGGVQSWGGQVLFRSFDETYLYPLSPIDPVIHDVDTEAQSSLIKNKKVRRGFHHSMIIRHAPFDSDEDEDEFGKVLEASLGAENAGGIVLLEDEFNSDKPDGSVRIDALKSDVDSRSLEYSEKSTANNIRKVFNNVPPVLVDFVEGQLGNTSGESLKAAIDFYNMQTEQERQVIEEDFNALMGNFALNFGDQWLITPMSASGQDSFEAENQKAQATLRGSVGGVQGVLSIQSSVSTGTTSRSSGVAMLVHIFGFDPVTANQILGDVKEEEVAI